MQAARSSNGNVDAQIDVRRYLTALQRNRGLMAAIVFVIAGAVLFLSLTLPKTYEATAQIVLDVQTDPLTPSDAESTQRQLATIDALINSSEVQAQAANEVDGETASSIESAMTSAVDPEANIVSVTAADGDPDTAADIANAVANTFLDRQRNLEQSRLEGVESDLETEIERLESQGGTAEDLAPLRERLNSVQVQRSTAGSELQLAETAEPPSGPASPKPFRNFVLAFFASLFIAVLVALGRDQLSPRLSSPRELSRVMGAPVLAGIPHVSRRKLLGGRSRRLSGAVEHEAYQTLRSSLQLGGTPGETRVVLITSAVHAEGKTTVTARLGAALARAGRRTLLVSADLRWPALHRAFDVPVQPGLTNALALVERAGISKHLLAAAAHPVVSAGGNSDEAPVLEIVPSGTKAPDPARLLSSDAFHQFMAHVRHQGYEFVLIDAPPLLGIADVQGMVQDVDDVILVSRLERLTIEKVVDMQELLERLGVRPMGLVVIGARTDVSPYYLTDRPALLPAAGAPEELKRQPRAYPG